MKWRVFCVLGGILAFVAAADGDRPRSETQRVIVQFKAEKDEAKVREKVEKHGGRVRKYFRKQGKGALAVVEVAEPVELAVEKFTKDPDVEFAEPDWIVRHQGIGEGTLTFKQEATEKTEKNENSVDVISPEAIANDTYYSAGYLWGLMDGGASSFGTRASAAWAAGYTGAKNVYVGVIDEGVQWQHADLAANMWNNPFDPVDGLDNDGNGYVDDAHGWDFYSDDNSVYDAGGDAHGTHVAGTIAAAGGNGRGVVGVNWNATVISTKFLGAEGGYVSDAIAAIEYYVDLKQRHGLNIVALNNSWGGGGYSQALHNAILRAAKAGILFVAAAGNGDANGVALNNDTVANYPSNYDTTRSTSTESAATYNAVIAVAAIDRYGALGTFSNFGLRTVHIGAPGVGVLSTVPGGYSYMDGTSMATPHVTGGIALYASTHPGKSANEIRQAILQSGASTVALQGRTTTGRRLNLGQVIAPATVASAPTAGRFEAAGFVSGQFRVKLTGVFGQRCDVQVSPDLVSWTTAGSVTNPTGVVEVTDNLSAPWPRKFYRAVTQ